ncbi:MAG TPA: hypothetical protein VIX87_04600, partial [Steroidobacteraceae bacterium]
MSGSRPLALGLWLLCMGLATMVVARAHFSADLSAFLPRAPSAAQRVLIDQLQNGLAARLILVGIEGGDAAQRAQVSSALTARLDAERAFLSVNNGAAATEQRDRTFLFEHRYELSAAMTPARFSVAGLRAAIQDTLDLIASP